MVKKIEEMQSEDKLKFKQHVKAQAEKENKFKARNCLNKIAAWPAVRSFNFDTQGNSKIATNLRAIITFPLLLTMLMVAIYTIFPVLFPSEHIQTEVTQELLRPVFGQFDNYTQPNPIINPVFSKIYKMAHK